MQRAKLFFISQVMYVGRENMCTVDGLHFDRIYNARVKAHNPAGASEYSELLSLQTAEGMHTTLTPPSFVHLYLIHPHHPTLDMITLKPYPPLLPPSTHILCPFTTPHPTYISISSDSFLLPIDFQLLALSNLSIPPLPTEAWVKVFRILSDFRILKILN